MSTPIEFRIGDKVKALVGFPDGHVELAVKTPSPFPDITLRVEPADVFEIEKVIKASIKWMDEIKAKGR